MNNTGTQLLKMKDFTICIRKQIQFQAGKGGLREAMYYTNYNNELGLQTDTWGMMVFIHVAKKCGFSDIEIKKELKLKDAEYFWLKEEAGVNISPACADPALYKIIKHKIGLLKNSILHHYNVKVPD